MEERILKRYSVPMDLPEPVLSDNAKYVVETRYA